MGDNNDIAAMLRSIQEGQKQQQTDFNGFTAEVRESSQRVEGKIDFLKSKLQVFEDKVSADITEIKEEASDIKRRLELLEEAYEQTQMQLKHPNLIFYGIQDSPNETMDDLYDKVFDVLRRVVDYQDLKVDNFYRIGNYDGTKHRKVRVRFTHHRVCDQIYENRKKAKPENTPVNQRVYINRDLTPAKDLEEFLIRSKAREISSMNRKPIINWKAKTI